MILYLHIDPITSNYIEETKSDDTIIVTEEFIKQLENELKTENKVLKGNKHDIFIKR